MTERGLERFEDRFFPYQPAASYDRIVWRKVLGEYLRWAPEKVEAEIGELLELVRRTSSFHYHETALWFVAVLMIPDDIRQRLNITELNRLTGALQGVVFPDREPDASLEEVESFDWDAAWERVTAFWAQYRSRSAED